jgi:hypothetical protein
MIRRRAAALVLPGALGACGVAPHEPGTDPVRSDGVTSFGDSAPVELCLGAARVLAPSASAGAAAVCVRAGEAPVPCEGDAQCQGIEQCVCGRCIVRACGGPSSCGDGLVCRARRCTTPCAADGECAAGERCVSGGCARSCVADAACHFGERCDSLDDVCVTQTCAPTMACGGGDACEPQVVRGEVREPDVVTVNGEALAFFELRAGPSLADVAIHRARIVAPRRWVVDPVEPVLIEGNHGPAGAPSIRALQGVATVTEGAIELYFSDSDRFIGRAVSTSGGRSFERDPEPILEATEPWEAGRIGSPSVFDRAGEVILAYEGGAGAGIGLARIRGGVAERLGADPVVTPATVLDPIFWRGVTSVGAPYGVIPPDGSAVRLYFTARGAEGSDALSSEGALPADINDSIGMVASSDFTSWHRFPTGPVFARITNLRAYLGEREAAIRLSPGAPPEIHFVGSDASGDVVNGVSAALGD